jgi:RNA polymerase sigma-70 factor (ECF subfamily)
MAQEIWLSVWDHRADYRPEGKFLAWLFTLARNRVRNAHRDAARASAIRGAAPNDAEPPDLSPTELDRLLVKERRARVDRALSNLGDTLREAVVLRFAMELPYDDLARVLDTNESTARSRVFHGLRELRRRLRGDL